MKSIFRDQLTHGIHALGDISVLTVFIILASSCSSSNKMHTQQAVDQKPNDSLLIDRDGNKYTIKAYANNSFWMTANLNLNIPESYCYENMEANCEKMGRLYTWASAQNACNLLGEGWRLPTDEDWTRLTGLYGGAYNNTSGSGKSAYSELLYTGKAQFNILLGGGRGPDGQYGRIDAHGFYWTATEIDSTTAWVYNFGKGSQTLYHQNGFEKTQAVSVRCVKRATAAR